MNYGTCTKKYFSGIRLYATFVFVSWMSSCAHKDDDTTKKLSADPSNTSGLVSHFQHKTSSRIQDLYVKWQNDSVINVNVAVSDKNRRSSIDFISKDKHMNQDYEAFDGPGEQAKPARKFTVDLNDRAKVYDVVIAIDTSFAIIEGDKSGGIEFDSLMLRLF